MKPSITTLTLNPAYDVHVSIDDFKLCRENTAESVSRDIGGKGINISRALHENGIDCNSVIVLGRENSAEFIRGMETENLNYTLLERDGRIRENITIHSANGNETRLSFKGFHCDASVLKEIEALLPSNGTITFTGSLPDGISQSDAETFLIKLKTNGAKLVIDSKSITLDMLRSIKPWLIKPNAEETEAYFGADMSERELCRKALELHSDGIENVMISLGGGGALLASGGALYRACVPKIDVISTIGAGDSSVAGFIASSGTPEERLRNAVSYGSAACMRDGTNPPLEKDVAEISKNVRIETITL